MGFRTNRSRPFAVILFEFIQLALVTESHLLAESFAFFAAPLTFQANSPAGLFIYQFSLSLNLISGSKSARLLSAFSMIDEVFGVKSKAKSRNGTPGRSAPHK